MVRSKAKITDDRATKAKVTDDRAAETDQTKTDTDNDGDECPPPSYSGPFSEGQKVLAYHCNRIYDAKVSKIEFRKKEWRYHVHYLGWNKDWDEWVGMDRLMIYNEENVQKQKDLDKMQGTDKNTKPGHASQIKPRNSALASSKKRKNDSVTELVKLLHEPNVDDILNKYFNDGLKNGMNVPREQEVGIGRETLNRPQISRLTFILPSPHQSSGTMDPNNASIDEDDGSSPLTTHTKNAKRGPTNLTIGTKGSSVDPKNAPIVEDGSSPLTANTKKAKRGPTNLTIRSNGKGTKVPNNASIGEEDGRPPLTANKKRAKRRPTNLTIGAKGTMDPNTASIGEEDGSSPVKGTMDPNSESIVEENESSPLVANKKTAKRGLTDLAIRAKGTMDPNSASVGEEDVSSPLVANKKGANSGPTDHTIGAKGNGTMDPSSASMGEEDGCSPLTGKRKRGKRGPTNLTIGAKGKGKEYKHELEFNQKGQPTGKSRKLTATDCGKLCRLYAPINCRTWKKVPQSVKEEMLEVIEANYECKNTTNWKARVLDKVGNRFRGFKHDMYKRFILPNLDNLEKIRDPPAGYSTITPEQWTDFVAQRTSKSWEKVRKKALETRSKNVDAHRLSRKGYAGLEEDMDPNLASIVEEDESSPLVANKKRAKRGLTDLEIRAKGTMDPNSASVCEEDASSPLVADKKKTSSEPTDLTIGAKGNGYFQTPHPSSASFQAAMKEMTEMKKYMMTLTSEVQRLGSQVTPFCPSTSPNADKKGSNSARGSIVGLESPQLSPSLHGPASPTTNIQKGKEKQAVVETNPSPPRPPLNKRHLEKDKGKPVVVQTNHAPPMPLDDKTKPRVCRLALGSINRVVAQGYLHDVGGSSLLHGSLLGEGNARVSVKSLEKAEYGSELLPIPTPDAITLVEAVGGFVSWPKHLVLLNTTMGHLKAPTKQGDFEIVVKNFAKLVDRATKQAPSAPIYVAVDQEIFGSDDPLYTPASEILVFRDELMDLINFKEIGVTIMKLYMCALNEKVKELGVDHTFRFAVPAGAKGHTGNDNVDQLFDTLETAEQGQLFFYPFNIGFHWVLAIIDPLHRHTLYFDPLGNEVDGNIIDIVSYACKNLDYSFKFTSNKKKATFEKVLCPIQPGTVECGYYVLRYMKDVILSHGTYPAQVFDNDECYEREMIDEVRVELMNYIRDNM